MARILRLLVFLSLCWFATAQADEYVNGYFKKDGTYVQGYMKSTPNSTNRDNYSTQGNINPYSRSSGTKAPDYSPNAQNYGGGRPINTGPQGGQYYFNDNGNKVYVPKR